MGVNVPFHQQNNCGTLSAPTYVPINNFNTTNQAGTFNNASLPMNNLNIANTQSFNGLPTNTFNHVQMNNCVPNFSHRQGQSFSHISPNSLNTHVMNSFDQTHRLHNGPGYSLDDMNNTNGETSQHFRTMPQTHQSSNLNGQNKAQQTGIYSNIDIPQFPEAQQNTPGQSNIEPRSSTKPQKSKSDSSSGNKSRQSELPDCYIVNASSSHGAVHLSSGNNSESGTDSYKLGQPLFEIRKELSAEPTDNGNKPFLCLRHPQRHRK